VGKKKLTIEDMQILAESKEGKCLSKEYLGSTKKLTWQCHKNHIWESTPSNIRNLKTWCPYCYKESIAKKIEDMQKIAYERGGRCLSEKYINNETKLTWECNKGHIWEAKPNHITSTAKSWCPICRGRKDKLYEGNENIELTKHRVSFSKSEWELIKRVKMISGSLTLNDFIREATLKEVKEILDNTNK